MKKIIVTRENYEEVMFELLENTYSRDVRENILDQIHADTFLNFEWQQWSKAVYSESTESYKNNEAEFIENLTRETSTAIVFEKTENLPAEDKEEKKKGFLFYMIPMAIAASLLLLIGLYILNVQEPLNSGEIARKHGPASKGILKEDKGNQLLPSTEENPKSIHYAERKNDRVNIEYTKPENIEADSSPMAPKTILVLEEKKEKPKEIPTFQDTIRQMIAAAKKQPRYKVTIVEEGADAVSDLSYNYVEKRYSMADVLNRKDGITLSKFLQNPNSRIVTDKNTNKVTIEYMAEDHAILVLTISN